MNKERWADLKYKVEQKFGNFETEKVNETLSDDMGNEISQLTESLIFQSEMGHIKISRTSHPKIVERKPHYHKGAGGAKIEFIVDPTEESAFVTVYKDRDGEWEKLELPPEKISF